MIEVNGIKYTRAELIELKIYYELSIDACRKLCLAEPENVEYYKNRISKYTDTVIRIKTHLGEM